MIILELMELFWLSFENMAEIKEPEQGLKTPQLLFFNLNPALKDGASELLFHYHEFQINILDIILLVNMVLDAEETDDYGDLNNEGIINILDIIMLVNIVLQR